MIKLPVKRFLISILLIFAAVLPFSGCQKDETETLLNRFNYEPEEDSLYLTATPLSYASAFASGLGVVSVDAGNSEGSINLDADAALLVDIESGEVLFQKNAHKREYPASTTKILTAILALKYADDSEVRTVGSEVEIEEDNIVMCDFRIGDEISFDIAIYGALLHSGNDAAAFLSKFVTEDTDEFVAMMNAEAAAIGATESHFVNPHGLHDDNHYTTAYDLYLLFNEAIQYKEFLDIIHTKEYTGTFVRTTIYNTYSIVASYENGNDYLMGLREAPKGVTVIGGKSGYTENALRCYVQLCEANGRRYIIVIMHSATKETMYADLYYLMEQIPVL